MKAKEVLRRYAAGERDFSGLNLRGQSFKSANLSGANFSETDIRSANFSGANLTGANFIGAKCGLQKRWATLLTIVSWLLAGISGFFSIFFGFLISLIFDRPNSTNQIFGLFGLLVLIGLLIIAIRWGMVAGGGAGVGVVAAVTVAVVAVVIVVAFTETEARTGAAVVAGGLVVAGAGAEAFIGARAVARTVAGAVGEGLAVIVAVVGVVVGAIAGAIGIAEAGARAVAFAGAVVYMGWRDMKGDKRNAWIRSFAIAMAAIGGTNFYGADLTQANFTGAKLKSTDLRKATLTGVRWYGAKMLDRVLPGDTYLKKTQLQQWIIGKGIDRNFDGQKLRGINLQGADLSDASFTGADLSEANLQDSDLSRAKLVQTQLDETDFTGATLTGTCIEDWGINSQTNLKDVICDYVYLKENLKERIPYDEDRKFQPGEFSKYVEKALNTVDLIFTDGIEEKKI